MKKNGYLRKFIAMFLVFVMLMADSSMTTFADVVGRSVQQNAVEDEENGIDLQSANDVNVTVTAPDGTYYVKLKQKENEWWASDIASASVQVQNGKGTCSLDGSNLNDSKENWLEIGLQENGSFVKSGEVLRSEGKIYSVTESNHAFTVNEISIQPGTQRNFKDILGSATNFGIVANEATFKGHLESNFAIGKLNYEGSNVQMSKNEGGGAGYNYIGEFVGSSQLQIGLNGNAGGSVVYAGKGAEGKLTTDNSDLLIDYDTYTEAQIKKIVKDMVDTIKTTSTTLYNENSVPYSAVTDISTSGNQYTDINIAKYGKDAGTYYVSFQPGEFNTFMSNPNRSITIREDQNIVLNVPDTNVDFRQFTFVIVDASGNVVYQKTTNANSDEDRVAENVIFNCPNATTAATYTSTGIFLVPNATFTNAIVSAGWVIANTIAAIGGQEWHNVYKGMPVVETTFQIKATKNVDNAPATDEKYDGKFSFELQEKDGENWKTIDSVTNTGSAIVFDNLGKFGTEGTHYYKIVETASALSDVTIDGEPVYVKAVIKKNGNKMVATVTYYSDENYATEVSDPSFNNTTVITEKTEVSVEKKWADNENQDRVRPGSIQVQLYADETAQGDPIELNEDNGWKYTWSNLEKKSGSNDIEYTVDEVSVPAGYTKTVTANEAKTSYVITNTHTTETTEATVRKVWNDSNDQDGKRPTSIIVNLLADGNATGTTVTLNEDNGWAATVNNLPKKANGTDIVYSWSEGNMPEGYSLTDTAKDGTVTTLTNSYSTEETSVSVRKVWTDSDNQDGKRPNSIKVRLLANGTEVATKDVTAADNWAYNFTDLPKYANGEEIVYTVTEDAVPDYTTAINGTTITNSYTPGKTSITVTKAWVDNDNQDGIRPDSIKVQLYAGEDAQGEEVTLDGTNNWTYTWTGLDAKKDGQDIVYTVKETGEVTGYTSEISGDAQTGFVITNTHKTEITSVEGKKVWDDADNQDGKRPESIKVRLLANGTEVATKDVTAADNWTYSFTDLPKFADGKEIVYTVTEDAVADYTTAIDGTTITNSYKPGKTSITVTKAWADNDNQDGIRPENIKVQLYAGETAQGEEVTLSADNNWTYTWSELDAKKDGQDIVYTVRETEVPAGYEAIVTGTAAEGFILTNTHETEVISVEGIKTWNDNDQTTKRPESITVRLLADGKEAGSQKVTADSNWTYKFTELPKYAAGKEIVYTVSEDAVPGYITSVNGNNLINTITSVKVSKVDITDHKELAGAHIQILDKDGNIIDEWDSTWEAHEVTGLKTNEQYTLRETVAPDGYTVTSDTTFTLKEDGTVDKDNTQTTVSDDGTLLVEDSKTSVKVSKVDIADGKELEGAHIQVIDEDENIVAEWDSTKEPRVIKGLKTDKKYILRETVAPTGYELTNDTTFVLKADGTVDTEKTTTVSKDGVLLVQDKLATGQSIAVTKKLTTITGDLRAMDQTFYVALYSDEACTQRVSDVKAIEFKNASSSTVVFNENIEVNKDYYIAECSQDGTAQSMGALADGTMYEAKFNNGNKATVKEANGTTTVYFDNVFSSIPDGYYKQGKLTITKKLLGADGNAKKSDNVFYAGIFDDADYTQLSTQVSQNIVKLDLAGGSEVSQVIKIGLDVNKTVTLYVTETDSNGKPVAGTSGFAYKVSVDGSTVTIDEANENASVTITNTENPTTTKTTKTTTEESGNESGSSASSHSMSSSTKAPKTGDDTPIAMYVIILIAAAALIVFGFEKRRRSNRK